MDRHACRLRDSLRDWPRALLVCLVWTSPAVALPTSDNRVDRNVCGRISLMSILHYVSGNSHAEELSQLLPNERAPFSLGEIEAAARMLGYQTRMMSWSSKAQAAFPCPAVVHVRARGTSQVPDHFIACFGETTGGLCVGDFPLPPFSVSREDFNDYWAGHTLYIDHPRSLRMYVLGSPLWMRLLAVDVGALILAACLIRRPASRCATENQ